ELREVHEQRRLHPVFVEPPLRAVREGDRFAAERQQDADAHGDNGTKAVIKSSRHWNDQRTSTYGLVRIGAGIACAVRSAYSAAAPWRRFRTPPVKRMRST